MATEKRLIDADKLEKLVVKHSAAYSHKDDILAAIAAQPTVDAVEVVRCKDCTFWQKRYETKGICLSHNTIVTFTPPSFYCACGERKNDGICKEG